MNNHPLKRFIKKGNFGKIDAYFRNKKNLTTEELELLLSGLKAKEWRVRHRCAKALRLGTLDLEACALLKRRLEDKEDSIVASTIISLMHQPLMRDFVCTFLLKKRTLFYYKRFPNALFLEELYKTAYKISFVDNRFSDFTDKALQAGIKKNTNILGCNTLAAIQYASTIGHNRQSTIEILLEIRKICSGEIENYIHPLLKEYSVNSLCALQLPSQEYKDQVYTLASRFGFWITLPNMLVFAKQFSFEEKQKKEFIFSILRRYGDITEEDYFALLELRRILQVDSELLLLDNDIRTHETNQSYSKSVFQVLIHGTNPFNYMPLQRTCILHCEIFEVIVDENTKKRFFLDDKRCKEPKFAKLKKVHQKDLKNLSLASDFTITEYLHNHQQQIHVSLKYGYKTDFRYLSDSYDRSFYRGDDENSCSDVTYESYIELAQREMYHMAFEDSASQLIVQLLDGISTGYIKEIETTWFWIEHNISPYYSTIRILSSFALTLLDIHYPEKERRSSIKGSAVEFIIAQTLQETLLYRLLEDFAIHHDNCKDIGSELEDFFEEVFQPKLSDNVNRAFNHILHGLKVESRNKYDFWLSWLKKRCQNTDLQKLIQQKRR